MSLVLIKDRSRRAVSISEFENMGTPQLVQKLKLSCPYDEQYILRMPIRVDDREWYVPPELEWINPALTVALHYQQYVLKVFHSFCYVTIRHGLVASVTDDEWHVDGFSTKITQVPEQNYIWSDHHGTEYANVSVKFPDDFDPRKHNVNSFLQQHVNDLPVYSCANETLYCLDPYMLHRRPPITNGTVRTFIRISFVPIEINDIHNHQNPMIPKTYNHDGVAFRNTLLVYGK